MDRKAQLIERIRNHAFVQKSGGVAGIVGSYGKGAETDIKADTDDIIVVANTGDIDLENERVIPSGADDSYFKANGQMFADHQYDIGSGAGVVRNISAYPSTENHKAWRLRVRLRDNDIGKAIRAIVDDTNQIGVSVGFVPVDYGPPTPDEQDALGGAFHSIVRTWKWFETSFTLLPCNVACQSMNITEGKSMDMVESADRLLGSSKISREAAAALGMPITAKRRFFSIPEQRVRVFTTDGLSYTKPA